MSSHANCDACDVVAFEPKPCAECVSLGDPSSAYCTDCRITCERCGETFCEEHAKKTFCRDCHAIENGPTDDELAAYYNQGSMFR